MDKLNLGVYEIAWLSWIQGLAIGGLLVLFCSCGVQFQYSLLNSAGHIDGIYQSSNDVNLEVSQDTDVNFFSNPTYNFNNNLDFRLDYARFNMYQPQVANWYYGNRYSFWRPYYRFNYPMGMDWFWMDWSWNYPFNRYNWGWNNWYNPLWNSNRRNVNYTYVNGNRGTRNNNSTVSNRISKFNTSNSPLRTQTRSTRTYNSNNYNRRPITRSTSIRSTNIRTSSNVRTLNRTRR